MYSKVTLVIADMNDENTLDIKEDVSNALRDNDVYAMMLMSNASVPNKMDVLLAGKASPEQADNASIQLRSTFQIDEIEWEQALTI